MTRRQGRAPNQRQLRVGEEIRHALAHILERGDIRDPGLSQRAVTVTEVRVSPDLRNATVYVTPFGGGDAQPILDGLKRVRAFLRHALAQAVQMRHVPELWFAEDTSLDQASRIDQLLRTSAVRRDIAGEADEGDFPDDQEGRDDGA